MRYSTGLLLVGAAFSYAGTQQCSGTAKDEGGNWFCGLVNHILYEGVGGNGGFDAVTAMDSSGQCSKSKQDFSGSLAPLDEGLSMHFRGPLNLKQAAVYNLKSDKKRRDVLAPSPHVHARRHGHSHLHHQKKKQFEERRQEEQQKQQPEKREDWVVVTMNGQVVSWVNNWFGPSSTVAPAAVAAPTDGSLLYEQAPSSEAPAPTAVNNAPAAASSAPSQAASDSGSSSGSKSGSKSGSDSGSSSSGSSNSGGSSSSGSSGSVGGPWDRIAYYNAEQGVVDNMVFMGNYGGQGSGVWDTTWGNSLAYLNSDGTGGSSSPQTLKDVTLKSNQEFSIFSAEKCGSSCGYSRASDIAYQGFSGPNKIFVWTFSMPHQTGSVLNNDMPALWLLNSRIPRTMQYGTCSCWPACGEADIYEVLAPGDTKCKSTIHLTNGGGSSDYFDRPTGGAITVATVFDEKTASISIKRLDDDFDYSEGLSTDTVNGWVNAPEDKMSSLFQMAN